jgi:hypothetical protein
MNSVMRTWARPGATVKQPKIKAAANHGIIGFKLQDWRQNIIFLDVILLIISRFFSAGQPITFTQPLRGGLQSNLLRAAGGIYAVSIVAGLVIVVSTTLMYLYFDKWF